MSEIRLSLFDFDGTLFRSPVPPGWWEGDWWDSIHSLTEPIVPNNPDQSWWVKSTYDKAVEAIADPGTYTVLATGRLDRVFRDRIKYLLKQNKLHFDEIHLNPGTETGFYKGTEFFKIVNKLPCLELIEVYDDRSDLLRAYSDMLMGCGFNVFPYLVKNPPMPVKFPSKLNFMAMRVAARYMRGLL